jgi:adenylate cyclase class IV
MVGQTRVHCDQVSGLGDFAELEVCLTDDQTTEDGVAIAHDLMKKLGIDKSNLIPGAYMDLIEAKKTATSL